MRVGLGVLAAATVAAVVTPGAWCGTPAGGWYDGPRMHGKGHALAIGVEGWLRDGVHADAFATGAARFDGEWVFGTHVMAALGFGQVALAELAAGGDVSDDLARLELAVARLDDADAMAFDVDAYRVSPLDDADGHAAWLGYGGLAYGMRDLVASKVAARDGRPWTPSPEAEAIEAAILGRLRLHPEDLVTTYPGERYPVDNASMIGALGLFASARGEPVGPEVARWSALTRRRWVDPETGLLVQAVGGDGRAFDGGRGSGTFLAAYFLSFADEALSTDLYRAGRDALYVDGGGFGAMREFPAGARGAPDIDSGPIVAGLGMSSTGFALAGARLTHDRDAFRGLYATTHLFGGPQPWGDGGTRFASGGPLGDAILLAMLTAGAGR